MADDSNSEKGRRLLQGLLNNEKVLRALSVAIVLHLAVWVNPCAGLSLGQADNEPHWGIEKHESLQRTNKPLR